MLQKNNGNNSCATEYAKSNGFCKTNWFDFLYMIRLILF